MMTELGKRFDKDYLACKAPGPEGAQGQRRRERQAGRNPIKNNFYVAWFFGVPVAHPGSTAQSNLVKAEMEPVLQVNEDSDESTDTRTGVPYHVYDHGTGMICPQPSQETHND
jgi:hypothetical protein